jgi:hypothetical protein
MQEDGTSSSSGRGATMTSEKGHELNELSFESMVLDSAMSREERCT